MDITVLTASMPERAVMLVECLASVYAQTLKPAAHVVEVDWRIAGFVNTINHMAGLVDTEWLMVLPDDDLIDPNHLATLAPHAENAEVVYSWCRVTGRPDFDPNAEFDADRLAYQNFIPGGACLIRTEAWHRAGGYRHGERNGAEDWGLWLRMLQQDARFVCVAEVTWTYRFGDWGNLSLGTLPAHRK